MRTTKTYAKEVLDLWKNETNLFNETITEEQFENMLRYHFNFGEAETITITMALIIAGAKFKAN